MCVLCAALDGGHEGLCRWICTGSGSFAQLWFGGLLRYSAAQQPCAIAALVGSDGLNSPRQYKPTLIACSRGCPGCLSSVELKPLSANTSPSKGAAASH
jgi:hypothetical protein